MSDKSVVACGIVPISVVNDEVYVLCGKEKGVYTGFGGGRKQKESVKESAVRECYEETLGLLGNEEYIKKTLDEWLYEELKISIGTNKFYVSYWVEFPYDVKLPKHYQNVNNYIKHCQRSDFSQEQKGNCFKKACFEKSEIKYFCLKNLLLTAKRYKKNNNITYIKDSKILFSTDFLNEVNILSVQLKGTISLE